MKRTPNSINWSDEERLLIRLLGAGISSDVWATISASKIDWEEFVALVNFHRVQCLVSTRLTAVDNTVIPQDIIDRIRQTCRKNTLQALSRIHATSQIVGALNQAGVKCLLLKSDAVGHRFYQDINARYSKDIDLLIPLDSFSKTPEILKNLGFEKEEFDFETSPGATNTLMAIRAYAPFGNIESSQSLELHWRMFSNPALFDLDFDVLFDRSDFITINHHSIRVMDRPTQFAYLACHGAAHNWVRLKWIVDIDRMLNAMNEEEISQAHDIARELGVQPMISSAIFLRHLIFEQNIDARGSESTPVKLACAQYIEIIRKRPVAKEQGIGEIGEIAGEMITRLKLKKGTRYKLWCWILFLVNPQDTYRLKLSRRWLPLYLLTGTFARLKRGIMTSIKRTSD